jgi:hypothetical protein
MKKITLNDIEHKLGINMQSIVNLFTPNPIELQDGWDMILSPMEFKNIGDCTPPNIYKNTINCQFYVGEEITNALNDSHKGWNIMDENIVLSIANILGIQDIAECVDITYSLEFNSITITIYL